MAGFGWAPWRLEHEINHGRRHQSGNATIIDE